MRPVVGLLLAGLLLAVTAATTGAGPAFPDRPVEIIAPAGVGGGWDTLSRLTARTLAEEKLVTQPITVTNMPGGSGAVAIAHVVTRRKGDAYTLIAFSPALTLTIVNRNTPYSYKDVVPITALSTDYDVLVVRKDSTINNLRTLLEVLKRDPNAGVVAGGSAPRSMDHIIFAKTARAGGVDPLKVRYIPFPGRDPGEDDQDEELGESAQRHPVVLFRRERRPIPPLPGGRHEELRDAPAGFGGRQVVDVG